MKLLKNQKGAFSPFIFGMLFALAAFSTMSAYWAQKDMIDQERKKIERQKEEATDLRRALENSIRTETADTYNQAINLNRAQAFTTLSTGETRGGQAVAFNAQESNVALGISNTRVVLSTSDDEMLRDDIDLLSTASGQAAYTSGQNQAVEFYDSQADRARQVDLSTDALNAEVAQVYAFYEANLRFPNGTEYGDINTMTGFSDVWGNDFTYTYIDDKTATLAFTTPWGYTQTINLDMNF